MLCVEGRFRRVLSIRSFATRRIKDYRRTLACRLHSNLNLQIVRYRGSGGGSHLDKKPSCIHVLLCPYRDRTGPNLLIGNNAGRRSVMIVSQSADAAHKKEACKAIEKTPGKRNPRSCETRTHGHDVYAG